MRIASADECRLHTAGMLSRLVSSRCQTLHPPCTSRRSHPPASRPNRCRRPAMNRRSLTRATGRAKERFQSCGAASRWSGQKAAREGAGTVLVFASTGPFPPARPRRPRPGYRCDRRSRRCRAARRRREGRNLHDPRDGRPRHAAARERRHGGTGRGRPHAAACPRSPTRFSRLCPSTGRAAVFLPELANW